MIKQKKDIDYKQTLFDKYKFIKKLKTGGFASVYIAQSIDNKKKKYAIKVMHKKNQRYARIQHKIYNLISQNKYTHGFVKLLQYGIKGQSHFSVMELLGQDLQEITLKRKKLSLKSALMVGLQAIDRIQALHKIGYLHRDIKPDNLMVGRRDNNKVIYLIDFGLSKKVNQDMSPNQVNKAIGTLGYMSVNAHLGKLLGKADDLESLIYTIAYFITGALPWINIKIRDPTDYHRVKEMKTRFQKYYNISGSPKLPKQIFQILNYVRSLKRQQLPDYLNMKYKLLQALKNIKENNDFNFDWCGRQEDINDSPNQKKNVEMKQHNQNVIEKQIFEVYNFLDQEKKSQIHQNIKRQKQSSSKSNNFQKEKLQFTNFLKNDQLSQMKGNYNQKIIAKKDDKLNKRQSQRLNSNIKPNNTKISNSRPNSAAQYKNKPLNPWQQQIDKVTKMNFIAPKIVINKTAIHKI